MWARSRHQEPVADTEGVEREQVGPSSTAPVPISPPPRTLRNPELLLTGSKLLSSPYNV
ncbi:hypothetical protein OG601_21340 [Streptomyces sp. NBC_01239]|nr:hypothetical protein [Streptomyces sp. NBC_01239]